MGPRHIDIYISGSYAHTDKQCIIQGLKVHWRTAAVAAVNELLCWQSYASCAHKLQPTSFAIASSMQADLTATAKHHHSIAQSKRHAALCCVFTPLAFYRKKPSLAALQLDAMACAEGEEMSSLLQQIMHCMQIMTVSRIAMPLKPLQCNVCIADSGSERLCSKLLWLQRPAWQRGLVIGHVQTQAADAHSLCLALLSGACRHRCSQLNSQIARSMIQIVYTDMRSLLSNKQAWTQGPMMQDSMECAPVCLLYGTPTAIGVHWHRQVPDGSYARSK